VASLWASKNLQGAQSKMAVSVERLSSGLRINRARDDAAGLGIANALTSQINGANQGVRNLNDGISLVQTAEGAIAAAQEMAQRVLTLATQGANDTLGDADRNAIRSEMRQLMTAVDSIAGRTKYSGISVLNATAISLQSSNITTDVITVSAAALAKIGVGGAVTGTAGYAVIDGTYAGGSTTGSALMTKINDNADDALDATTMNAIATAADAYITALSTQRGLLGAAQNQIEYTVNNVNELSSNLSAARSNVQDTDYASETASLTKGQILQQAATAMLAQANQMPNVILSLLK
ncbi:MAG: flagellin, partial [Burkholderiales bacterium]|nr:flagellin [Burkholderiales bacterium]